MGVGGRRMTRLHTRVRTATRVTPEHGMEQPDRDRINCGGVWVCCVSSGGSVKLKLQPTTHFIVCLHSAAGEPGTVST